MGCEMSEIRVERENKSESVHGKSTLWYRGGAKERKRKEEREGAGKEKLFIYLVRGQRHDGKGKRRHCVLHVHVFLTEKKNQR